MLIVSINLLFLFGPLNLESHISFNIGWKCELGTSWLTLLSNEEKILSMHAESHFCILGRYQDIVRLKDCYMKQWRLAMIFIFIFYICFHKTEWRQAQNHPAGECSSAGTHWPIIFGEVCISIILRLLIFRSVGSPSRKMPWFMVHLLSATSSGCHQTSCHLRAVSIHWK